MPDDTFDPSAIRLQADLLRLGHALAERRDGTHGDERLVKQAEIEVLERQLLLDIRVVADRKLFGIQGNFSTPSDIVRVRGAAYIGWEMIAECDPSTRIEQVSRAIADPTQPHYQEILVVRDALARAVIDGIFLLSADNNGSWGGKILLPPNFFSWLNGGNTKSKGDFSPKKIAAGRLQRTRTSTGGETDDLLPAPLTARQIADKIAARVVGMQEGGQLDVISGRLAMHMRRAKMLAAGQDPGTPNESVLVLGESSTGKSWICEQSGIATGLPQASANAAEMSASGYVGLSVEDGLRGLYLNSKCRPEVCRFGVMTFDEITKKAGSQNESAVNSTAVLNEMLRLVQGQETQVGGKRSGNEPSFTINTYGMFFFLCGHAPGLDHLIEKRLGGKSIGFGNDKSRSGTRGILLDALEDYGLPAELLNRLTAIVTTPTPSIQSLCKAATSPKGVIQSYARLLDNGDFRFQDKAVIEMAEHCRATRLYYRGIASIVSALAAEALTSERRGSIIVTPADVRRVVNGMDDGVANLLQKTGRHRAVETAPEDIECDVTDLATA